MEKQLNIVIVGVQGRMGTELRNVIRHNPDYKLAGAIDLQKYISNMKNLHCPISYSLKDIIAYIDECVIIDFTNAEASVKNAATAAEYKKPIVIGSTGLNEDQKKRLTEIATSNPTLWSANMSVGINVLLRILPELVKGLGSAYDIELVELHHRLKKDAPSGTALMLGDVLAKTRLWELEDVRVSSRDGLIGERKDKEIGIQALRGGDIPGIHNVYFLGPGEFIEVTHHAESRENFARGALRAAQWLADKPAGPLYSMQDVIWHKSK